MQSKRKSKPLGIKAGTISFISSESNVPERLYDKIDNFGYFEMRTVCIRPSTAYRIRSEWNCEYSINFLDGCSRRIYVII